ncbi:MAG TPA: phage tail protein I, partial [Erwinia persicina]|nr:phage tail protein I [Erwinia persicina]
YVINITEWWQNQEPPGTFRLEIGVLESGIDEAMFNEMERLIADAKAVSRHLTALTITQDIQGIVWTGAVQYDAETVTIFPA